MYVRDFTKTNSDTFISQYAVVSGESNPTISTTIYGKSKTDTADKLHIGRSLSAITKVYNVNGTIYAKVGING